MGKLTFWALAKKEFFGYVNSPQAYVVMVPFILISHFLFFRTAFLTGDANMRPFVELLPWFLIVIGPALAMRSFSDEYRKETLELLFAHPVSEWTIMLSKFTGLLMFYGLILLATASIPITLIAFSKADVGLILSQYVGSVFIGSAFVAVGIAASVFIKAAVGSFLTGAAISFVLVLLGMQFVTMMFPGVLGLIVNELAIMTHLTNLSRGVMDLRDIFYFATVAIVALAAGVYKLSERKLAESPAEKRSLMVIFVLIATIALAGNVLLAAYPIRLDLTANHQFSLSTGTKQLLKDLPDRLTITLYATRNLPAQMQVTLRETGDRMKDFARYSRRITLQTAYAEDPKVKEEATTKGIREVQFNQIGSSSFAVQTGFLGLSFRYGDKTEVIPFVEDASDLEYQMSRLILKLTRDAQTKLAIVEAAEDSQTNTLTSLLQDQYDIVRVFDSSTDKDIAEVKGVVVIDDGSQKNASTAAMLKQYIQNNGNVLMFVDGVKVDQRSLAGTASTSEYLNLLKDFGVTVNTDIVYDLQLNEAIALPVQNTRVIINYPFWVRGLVTDKGLPWSDQLSNVLLGWPSSLAITNKEGVSVQKIVTTGPAGGHQEKNYTINPSNRTDMSNLPQPSKDPQVMAVAITKGNQRLGVVADQNLLSDDFLKNSQEDQTFVTNFIDWVAADPILASIPKRTGGRNVFTFTSTTQAQATQYADLILPPVVIALVGIWWLKRRRKLSMRIYTD